MAESESIKEAVNQVAIQAAITVMMVLKDTEAEPQLTTMVSHIESHNDSSRVGQYL